jgi:hypothetical protein
MWLKPWHGFYPPNHLGSQDKSSESMEVWGVYCQGRVPPPEAFHAQSVLALFQ